MLFKSSYKHEGLSCLGWEFFSRLKMCVDATAHVCLRARESERGIVLAVVFVPVWTKQGRQECAFLCLNKEIWNHEKKSSALLLSFLLSLLLFSSCECACIYLWCLFSRSICFCTLSWLPVCKSLCTGMPWLSMYQCAALTIIRRQTAACLPQLSDASSLHLNILFFF